MGFGTCLPALPGPGRQNVKKLKIPSRVFKNQQFGALQDDKPYSIYELVVLRYGYLFFIFYLNSPDWFIVTEIAVTIQFTSKWIINKF